MTCPADTIELTVDNKQVCLASYPKGLVTTENFVVTQHKASFSIPVRSAPKNGAGAHEEGAGDVLLKTLWVSVDPYLRLRMLESAGGLYFNTFQIGKPLSSATLCQVIASGNPNFKEGDIVIGFLDIAEYVLVERGENIQKVDDVPGVPLSYHLGVLGLSGFTAWVGLNIIGETKNGEEVYISAAAGAVGIVAGQLAKLKGCHVVGSAGTDEKVKMLKEEFGFDEAFNYKTEKDWGEALGRYFPKGIDVYFENVGGSMLEAVLQHINRKGRIPICGMVSQYNQEWTETVGVRNLMNLVGNCVKMEGFLALNHVKTWPQFMKDMSSYISQGKIKYQEHVFKGMENFPSVFVGLFNGENIGKALIQV